MDNPLLAAALGYAHRGFSVIPLVPRGKRPAVKTGDGHAEAATTDALTIERWWSECPNANVGIVLEPSRLVVLDVDGPEGQDALDDLAQAHGNDLSPSAAVETARGQHTYYRVPEGFDVPSSTTLETKLDFLAAGKQVVAPPSVHPTGAIYRWVDGSGLDQLTDGPPWLLDGGKSQATPRLQPVRPASNSHAVRRLDALTREVREAPRGERNNRLNHASNIAGRLVASGHLVRSGVEARLLDAATTSGLRTREARSTVTSGLDAGIAAGPDPEHQEPAASPDFTPSTRPEAEDVRDGVLWGESHASRRPGRRPRLVPASSYEPEAVQWVWEGRIPAGACTLLAGIGGLGKSTLAIDLTARLTRGQLAGRYRDTPASVLYATAEDGWARVMVPRLMAAGADLDRIIDFAVEDTEDGFALGMSLPEDIDLLDEAIKLTHARLVVIDPLVAYLSDRIDSHRDHQIRRALAALQRVAENTDAAVLGIVHLNKRESRSAADRISGSVGFYNASRSVLLFTEDQDDENDNLRLLTQPKSNLGPRSVSLRNRVETTEVETADQPVRTSRMAWLGEAPDVAADEGLAVLADRDERTALEEAIEFLRSELAQGPLASTHLISAAKREQISEKTLRRAKKRLRILARKDGPDGGWRWHLPPQDGHQPQAHHLGHVGHVGLSHLQGGQDGQLGVSRESGHLDDGPADIGGSSDDGTTGTPNLSPPSSLSPSDPQLGLLAEVFGPIVVLKREEAELRIADFAIRQWNYLIDHPPGTKASDLCRCGRGQTAVTADGRPHCDICGPPGTSRSVPDTGRSETREQSFGSTRGDRRQGTDS